LSVSVEVDKKVCTVEFCDTAGQVRKHSANVSEHTAIFI
jgi:hypothetical protein